MRVTLVLLLALLFTPRIAAAEKSVGVLVTGEYLRGPTQTQAEAWLRQNGHRVVTNPMPSDAVKILLDCFVLDDPKCMRSVVDARSTTDSLVSIRVDIASKKKKEVRLTVDWFVKGHSPASARRTCDDCTEEVLRSTIESLLSGLVASLPGFTGKLKVTSNPAGITVLLDGATIGVTPIERDVTVGDHKVQLVRDGRTGPEKTITVESKNLAEVALEAPPAGPTIGEIPPGGGKGGASRSRLVPGLMIGLGVAGIGAGAALYLTSEEPTGESEFYTDTKTPGIVIGAAGAAVALTGVIIILATGSSSAPTVALTPGGASVGWAGRF